MRELHKQILMQGAGGATKLTVVSSEVNGTHSDFPVLVDLSDMPAKFWNTVANGGGDIRVYDSEAKTTEYAREVVSCDTGANTGELWVKIPSLSTSTVIWIFVDGTSSDYAETATYGSQNVWSDYAYVDHLNGDGDRTDEGNVMTENGGITQGGGTGKFGDATDFDGTDDYLRDTSFTGDGLSEFTIATYIKSDGTGVDAAICGEGISIDTDDNSTGLRYDSSGFEGGGTNVIKFAVKNSSGTIENGETESSVQTTNWQKLTLRWSGGTAPEVLIDGTETVYTSAAGSLSGTVDMGAFGLGIGLAAGKGIFEGLIDEVRVKKSKVNDDWESTEYNNWNNPTNFWTIE